MSATPDFFILHKSHKLAQCKLLKINTKLTYFATKDLKEILIKKINKIFKKDFKIYTLDLHDVSLVFWKYAIFLVKFKILINDYKSLWMTYLECAD